MRAKLKASDIDTLHMSLFKWAVKELKKDDANIHVELGFLWNAKETALQAGGQIIFMGPKSDMHYVDALEMMMGSKYYFDAGTDTESGARIWYIDKITTEVKVDTVEQTAYQLEELQNIFTNLKY